MSTSSIGRVSTESAVSVNSAAVDEPMTTLKIPLGKQAALWLSEQIGVVGFAEAGRRFGIHRSAVHQAWKALELGRTPREKIRIALDGEDPVAAQHARKLAYMREYSPKAWLINKERLTTQRRIARERLYAEDPRAAWLKESFKNARGRAGKAGLSFDLECPTLELPDACPVLGVTLDYSCNKGCRQPNSPSLDRIRPGLGYVTANLRVISFRANSLKNDATIAELRAVLSYMERAGCL